jgi:Ca2+-binding EF-hand superfamily protein
LRKDSILKDEYGEITFEMLKDANILFEKFDRNQDGYITPLDVDEILQLMEKYPLSFNCDIIMNMVHFFVFTNMKIEFNEFVLNFAYI